MADFKLRLSDDLAYRFDLWAGDYGGRSPALRYLIDRACSVKDDAKRDPAKLMRRPAKLTVRLTVEDSRTLDQQAFEVGLTRNAWVAALVRQRLTGRPTFARREEVSLLAIQGEIHRIGVNINQIARALNTAVLEGKVVELELVYLSELRQELQLHITALRAAFEGNLAYWSVAP